MTQSIRASSPPPEGWTIIDENGETAVAFTSFIDIDVRSDGQALSYPVERGGFANYNKVQSPLDVRVTLAVQGNEPDFKYALFWLDEYQKKAVKLSVVTPAALYHNMTLKAYSSKRGRDSGAGLLVVELHLVEVSEIDPQIESETISEPKNPTSSEKVNIGKTPPKNAAAYHKYLILN